MNVQPITDTSPVCFGVCCPKHGTCERYARVDGAAAHELRIDFCGIEHSLYVPILPAVAEQVAA